MGPAGRLIRDLLGHRHTRPTSFNPDEARARRRRGGDGPVPGARLNRIDPKPAGGHPLGVLNPAARRQSLQSAPGLAAALGWCSRYGEQWRTRPAGLSGEEPAGAPVTGDDVGQAVTGGPPGNCPKVVDISHRGGYVARATRPDGGDHRLTATVLQGGEHLADGTAVTGADVEGVRTTGVLQQSTHRTVGLSHVGDVDEVAGAAAIGATRCHLPHRPRRPPTNGCTRAGGRASVRS